MPEFEETKPNPDLHKDSHQYQPGKSKTGQESTSSAPSSNMRGRWKRPTTRSNTQKTVAKDDIQTSRPSPAKEPVHQEREERSFSPNEDYEIEDYEIEEIEEIEDEQESEFEQREDQDPRPIRETRKHHHTEPRHSRDEYTPRTLASKKTIEEKPFKPTSRKDVFIPKTKQDSERYRRNPSKAKKISLWKKILAFFGLGKSAKKHSTEHRTYSRNSDSSRGHRSGSQNRRPYQQKRHSGQHQRHRSGPPHKNDQKSND